MSKKFKTYLKSIIVPVLIGSIVGFIISGSIDYNSLQKPPLSPPSMTFPIVWTILYILMGISYGILASNSLVDSKINSIYYLQLFFNALWPIAFFLFKWRLFAFIWIIILAILIIIMIARFYEKHKTAAWLQVPYLLWTLFATYLNFGVYLLNR
jgi:benzodiazapine receptor